MSPGCTLVPAIHVFDLAYDSKAWMPGTRPGMTKKTSDRPYKSSPA
jgi:hypothetical protein